MDTLQGSFEHLSPPMEVHHLQHDPGYIKSGIREMAERRIFYGVPLDDFEVGKIQEVEGGLAKKGIPLPPGWNDRETLRYIYGAKFNIENAINKILECLQWRGSHNRNLVPESSMRLLESGAIYTYGRDQQYRPIVIADLGKFNIENVDLESFEVATITLLDILKEYCFVPGKVENWIVIVDARGKDFSRIPAQSLRSLFSILNACYPVTLERLFVVNTSHSLIGAWYQVEGLISPDAVKKIVLLEPGQLSRLQKFIPPNQLESKFTGSLPDLNKFWIPRVPLNTFTSPRSQNLESSLARLSQQIDDVEGRFNRILTNDGNVRKSQTQLGPLPTTNYPLSSQQMNYSLPPPTTNYYTTTLNPYSTQLPTTTYDYSGEKAKRSAAHLTTFGYDDPLLRPQKPNLPVVTTHYNNELPKRRPQEDIEDPNKQIVDFKDKELLSLILNENTNLRTGKPSDDIYRHDPLNGVDYYKNLDRASTGAKPKTFNDYTIGPERSTQIPDTIITKHSTLMDKRSSPYSDPLFKSDPYLTSPNPRFLPGRTEYEVPKSLNERGLEEWPHRRYIQKPIEDEDEDDEESNFCGICVSRRRKPTKV